MDYYLLKIVYRTLDAYVIIWIQVFYLGMKKEVYLKAA